MGAIVYDWQAVKADVDAGLRPSQLVKKYGFAYATLREGLKRLNEVNEKRLQREHAHIRADDITMMERGQPAVMYEPGYIDRTETLAEIGAHVLVRHRRAFAHTQNIIAKMKAKIEHLLDNAPEIEQAVVEYYGAKAALEPLKAASYAQMLSSALHALSVHQISKSVLNIVSAEKQLSESERKAYRLDEEEDEKGYEHYLKEMHDKIDEIKAAEAANLPLLPAAKKATA